MWCPLDIRNQVRNRVVELIIAASAAGGGGLSAQAAEKGSEPLEAISVMDSKTLSARIRQGIAEDDYLELAPALVRNYAELEQAVKEMGYAGKPIIYHDTTNGRRVPEVTVLGKLEGKPVVLANGAAIKVTPEYAKLYAMVSPKEMAGWVLARQAGLPQTVLQAHAKLSAKQGFPKPPDVYVNLRDKSPLPSAQTAFTYKGEHVILLNKAKLRQPPAEILASLAHENEHVAKKDVQPENMAEAINNPAYSRSREYAADQGAAHLCRPGALADGIDRIIRMKARRAAILSDNLSPQEALRRYAETGERSTHPSFVDRVQRIRQLPENTPGCISLFDSGRKR